MNDILVMVDNNEIIKSFKIKRGFIKNKGKMLINNNLDKIEKASNSKLYIFYEGEEIYIKLLELPNMPTIFIHNAILNELMFIMKDIRGMSYEYEVISKNKEGIKVLIFCINTDSKKLFKGLRKFGRIKAAYLIQLMFYYHIRKNITFNKFLLILGYNNKIYLMAFAKGFLISNTIIKYYSGDVLEMISKVEYVLDRAKEIDSILVSDNEKYNICFLNFNYDDVINCIGKQYDCVDLGCLEVEAILKEYMVY